MPKKLSIVPIPEPEPDPFDVTLAAFQDVQRRREEFCQPYRDAADEAERALNVARGRLSSLKEQLPAAIDSGDVDQASAIEDRIIEADRAVRKAEIRLSACGGWSKRFAQELQDFQNEIHRAHFAHLDSWKNRIKAASEKAMERKTEYLDSLADLFTLISEASRFAGPNSKEFENFGIDVEITQPYVEFYTGQRRSREAKNAQLRT